MKSTWLVDSGRCLITITLLFNIWSSRVRPILKPDLFIYICQHWGHSSCLDQLFLSFFFVFFLFLRSPSYTTLPFISYSAYFVSISYSLVFAITMSGSQLCCQLFITGSPAPKSLDHYSPHTDKGSNLWCVFIKASVWKGAKKLKNRSASSSSLTPQTSSGHFRYWFLLEMWAKPS